MNQKILFYDINATNFYKYIPYLLEHFDSLGNCEILLVYDENPNDQAKAFLNKFKTQKVGFSNTIKKIVKDFNPSHVVVNAQRIPDTYLISYSKSLGIKTVMIQHGMYNGFLERNKSMYLLKLLKAIKYLIYSLKIGYIIGANPIFTAVKFVKIFQFGNSYKKLLGKHDLLFVDKIQVYGNYWIDYHKSFFGYKTENTEFQIIGYHELNKDFNNSKKIKYCYIAQTLFEDGRIERDSIDEVVEFLTRLNKTGSLIVKRHPRSNDSLYLSKGLEITDELYEADFYIGHYSSLLALPIFKRKKIILLPLKNHIIPSYFIENSYLFSDWKINNEIPNLNFENNSIENIFSKPVSVQKQYELLIQSKQ
tara:strand:- start:382 stop:1473 length:1092 start_codon:yes stop_codon:yes gene_type:complete